MSQRTIRILHTGDWHLGVYLAGHQRLEEQLERLKEIVNIAIDREVDVVVVAGDVYYERLSARMASAITQRMVEVILPLAQKGITTIMLSGNHDHDEWFGMLESLMKLGVAHIGAQGDNTASSRPLEVVRTNRIVNAKGAQFVCIPYPIREIVQAKLGHKVDEEDDPRMARNRVVTEGVTKAIQQLVDSSRFNSNMPSILVGHFTTSNAQTPDQEEGFLQNFSGDFVIPASVIPNRFVYGAFGHIHMPQDLHSTKQGKFPFTARYCGSPVKLNMGERKDEKSVTMVSITTDTDVHVEVIPLQQTEMHSIECDVEELEKYAKEAALYKNAFVRLRITHDGTVPEYRIIQQARKIFPKHVGIKLIGPKQTMTSVEERSALANGTSEASVEWNPEDHQGTVHNYLEEVLKENINVNKIISKAEDLVFEAERLFYGDPQSIPTGSSSAPTADNADIK